MVEESSFCCAAAVVAVIAVVAAARLTILLNVASRALSINLVAAHVLRCILKCKRQTGSICMNIFLWGGCDLKPPKMRYERCQCRCSTMNMSERQER